MPEQRDEDTEPRGQSDAQYHPDCTFEEPETKLEEDVQAPQETPRYLARKRKTVYTSRKAVHDCLIRRIAVEIHCPLKSDRDDDCTFGIPSALCQTE